MFIAALAHKYSFPHKPYHINVPDYGSNRTWFSSLAAMWDVTDVTNDVTEHLGVVGNSLTRRFQFRGRTSYHLTRGNSETDRLMRNSMNAGASTSCGYNPSTSDSDLSTTTQKNHYGALSSSDDPIAILDDIVPVHGKQDGINIVKQNQKQKEYSPQYGVPKVLGNYFTQQSRIQNPTQSSASSSRYDRSTKSDNTASRSESGFDLLAYDKAANEDTQSQAMAMKKSDSTASDWLSTPTDDFMGIDVKGIEKDRSHFRRDPKV